MIYTVQNKVFELEDIFECGQCFRWNKMQDGSYTGIFGKNVINVQKQENNVIFKGNTEGDIKQVCDEYFDLNRDYESIMKELSKVDDNLKISIQHGKGIRILSQDLWETIISFIISANNNIPRIKGIIERLSKAYGQKIVWEDREYYTFPLPNELKDVKVEEFRALGLGFRDVRLYETTKMILDKEVDLNEIHKMTTKNAREELLKLSGVGPKVADCILLFSTLKRFDVFPIDVWVRRVMNDLYIKKQDETKVSKKEIQELADNKFGSLQGLAQQYLFNYRRNHELESNIQAS